MHRVFFSYSHKDEQLRDQLEVQLAMLKRQGVIETWHDRRIGAGNEIDKAINERIETDEIILLLVSPDFLASDYCYDREMTRAMERHEASEAIVIPVILRPCDWHGAPFGKLLATPRDGKPITQWADRDEAFLDVAKAIREAAGRLGVAAKPRPEAALPTVVAAGYAAGKLTESDHQIAEMILERIGGVQPRSSNLRLAKRFTDRDQDRFRLDSFEFMAKFFEASVAELAARNSGIEGQVRRVDGNRFTAAIYRDGKAVARGTVFMDGGFGTNTINYVDGERSDSNGFNESLHIEADDQSLYFRSMGLATIGRARDVKLSQEGAAEQFWSILMRPLQGKN